VNAIGVPQLVYYTSFTELVPQGHLPLLQADVQSREQRIFTVQPKDVKRVFIFRVCGVMGCWFGLLD
jgi:hypothetical protein